MGLLKIREFDAPPTKSGISISQGETRGRAFFRITLTEAAQREYFGRPLQPGRDAIVLTLTDDPKLLHLMGIKCASATDPEALSIKTAPRGSVFLKTHAWRKAQGKMPTSALEIINAQVSDRGICVKLPTWARPERDPRA